MNTTKFSSTLVAVGLVCLAAVSCSKNTNPASQANGSAKTVSVAFSIKTNQEFNRVATTAIVKVTAPDMDSIQQPMMITDSAMYATVRNVPVGKDRLFEIFVFDSSYMVRYYGSQRTDIQPFVATYVLIKLRKPTSGVVEVIGTIEDDSVPDTNWISVSMPFRPWPIVTETGNPDTGTGYYEFSSGGASCSNGDPVEYGFTFVATGVFTDTNPQTKWVTGEYIYQYLPYPGTYRVYVRARDAVRQSIESATSGPLQVTAISPYKIVMDSLPPDTSGGPDTIPIVTPFDTIFGDTTWIVPSGCQNCLKKAIGKR
jgi:hypothetical protein